MEAAYVHPWRLTFLLPATLVLRARLGVHHPSLAGCLLHVKRGGLIEIGGPSREAVFDQVARFLRILIKGMNLPATVITARSSSTFGRDNWQIVIGAQIAFMPGGIEPHVPKEVMPPDPHWSTQHETRPLPILPRRRGGVISRIASDNDPSRKESA